MNFGLAIEALKDGKMVSRAGWNGKGMFVFMRPSDEISLNTVMFNVKSIPQSVKDFLSRKTDPSKEDRLNGESRIKFCSYLCMYAADGSIVNGWLASQTDMLAEDWGILD